MIGHLVVGVILRIEVEAIDVRPRAVHERLQDVAGRFAGPFEAESAVRRDLFEARLERERRGKRHAAEADVGEERAFVEIDEQQHMRARRHVRQLAAPQDASCEAAHAKTERLKYAAKQQVVLVAVAAAPSGDELALDRFEIEPDRAADQHVEIFEGNGLRMQQMQRAQCVERRRGPHGFRVPDALEVGGEVDGSVVCVHMEFRLRQASMSQCPRVLSSGAHILRHERLKITKCIRYSSRELATRRSNELCRIDAGLSRFKRN